MIKNLSRKVASLIGAFIFIAQPSLHAADTNVLVIGSSKSYSDDEYSTITRNQKPFNPQLVVAELQKILDDDAAALGTANVVFEDVYQTTTRTMFSSNYTVKGYSLLNYYYWPDARTDRLNNLKGANGTAWDYVIILGDPSLIANTPGVYAKGVKLIVDKVKEGTAQPILMMQWPHDGSAVPVADFAEVTYRVGDSGGIPVAPAGYAWNALATKDTGTHPTPKGAYLAAATLYHKIKTFEQTANTTTYVYPGDDGTLATLAYDAVHPTVAPINYSGVYSKEDPYHILGEKSRVIKSDRGAGSSTEQSFLSWGQYNNNRYFNALLRPQLLISDYGDDNDYSGLTHFHIGRAFGGTKAYRVWPATYKYAMGFPFQIRNQDSDTGDGGMDMLYGIDTLAGSRGDQRVAFHMISNDQVSSGIRNMPVFSIWAAAKDELSITTPFADGKHYREEVNEAVVCYMMTLLTGRCPIGKNDTADMRTRRRIGYETAWIYSTLNIRPPGFTTQPSAHDAKTVTPSTGDTMSVYFVNPPESSVTVDVSSSANTAAIVNPKVLTFDGTNYDTIQNVRVVGVPGANSAEAFDVNFQSTSSDMCFADLADSWKYTNNRVSTESLTLVDQADRQEAVPKNSGKTIDLQVAGSLEGNTVLAQPFHGTLSWSGADVVYTPDTDYVGNDSFAFAVNTGGTLTKGYIEISVEDLPAVIIIESGDSTDVVEGGATDTYTVFLNEAPAANVTVTLSTDSQVTVSPTTLTYTTGDYSDPQTVTVTAVNDSDHELNHNGTVSHATSSTEPNWDSLSVNDVIAAITDNDNQVPTVDAGTNQTVFLGEGAPWTPADISPVAWFDAADTSTFTESDGLVTSGWADKSVNGNDAVKKGTPAYISSDPMMNNMPSISHDASGQHGFTTPSMSIKNVYAVVYYGTGLETSFPLWRSLLSNAGNAPHLMGNSGNSTWSTGIANEYYRNGTDVSSSTALTMPATMWKFKNSTAVAQTFGIGYGSSNRGWNGGYCEFVFTDGTEDADAEQMIEGYLAHKWGLEGNLPTAHPYKSAPPGGAGAVVTLAGTASDADSDPLTTGWTVVSQPAGSNVSFDDNSLVNAAVPFDTIGTYVLRLTADDGTDQVSDDVTITVDPAPTASYTTWAGNSFTHPFNDVGVNQDPDGDGVTNLVEFAFGSDPTLNDRDSLLVDGSVNGFPVPVSGDGGATFDFVFVRRDDHGSSGSLNYIVQFSSDLATFYGDDEDDYTITFVADSSADSDYEVVKVTYPTTLPNGEEATFGRVMLTEEP